MSTKGVSRHEQDRPMVVQTLEEVVRFALALQGSAWAHTAAVPASWRYIHNGNDNPAEWRDMATGRPLPKDDVHEAITEAVERDFGFTPTPREVNFIALDCVAPCRSTDALHRFMREAFVPALGEDVTLDEVWSRWRQWKPAERPRIPQAQLIEELKARGYAVVMTSDEEGVIRGWRRRPKVLSVGTAKKKGCTRKDGGGV